LRVTLPIDPILDEIVAALEQGSVVLEAPPGAGKTTRVPPALLQHLNRTKQSTKEIWVIEPRRLAARLAATRVAEELGKKLGGQVGYTVRFDNRTSSETRLRFLTTGVALKMLVSQPKLSSVETIVFDEVHERQLDMDLLLCWAKHLKQSTRPDLRLLAMSATLDAEPIAQWLNATRIQSEGRSFPTTIQYEPTLGSQRQTPSMGAQVARIIDGLPTDHTGDILVFLPGVREIEAVRAALAATCAAKNIRITALHASMGPTKIQRALQPCPQKQIILSTNIAESSVTLPNVHTVIDTGLAKIPRSNPWTGLLHLDVEAVARDSAIQRAGRAGRTAPGECFRLYSESNFQQRPATLEPAIQRMDLTALRLTLAHLRVANPALLPWLSSPDSARLAAATELLTRLEFIDTNGEITPDGDLASALPCHPRLARLLLSCARSGHAEIAAHLVAVLSSGGTYYRAPHHHPESDVLGLLESMSSLEGEARRTKTDLIRRVKEIKVTLSQDRQEDCLARAILAGFPDRLCRRQSGLRLARVDAGAAVLDKNSAVSSEDWLVGLDARPGSPPRISLASPVESEWLWDQPGADTDLTEAIEATWDHNAERVRVDRVSRYRGLPLERESISARGLPETVTTLLEHIKTTSIGRITDLEALRVYRRRRSLAHEIEPAIPALTDTCIEESLRAFCADAVGLRELVKKDFLTHLKNNLDWNQNQALNSLLPLRIELPNGRRANVEYPDEGPPRISVRVQHVLGLRQGPRLAGGRLPVLLQLLAPNQRPVQLTDDLAGFWERTWPSVRKELRGRYPKHAWPEDPTQAPKPRPRKK
jgi:ATP-dependent helicase HrpB